MKNRILLIPLSLLFVVPILTACGFPNSTDMQPPASAEAIQTAVYIPQPAETPVTALWNAAQASCDGKSLYAWREAGTFTWNFSYPGYDEVAMVTQAEGAYSTPGDSDCGWLPVGLGEIMKGPPVEGAHAQWSGSCQVAAIGSIKTIAQEITITVSGWEEKTTRLGTFRALRVKSLNQYADGTTPGVVEVNDWYVCGYGRVYSESVDANTDTKYMDELLSFTPPSTDEPRVRYILADIQLVKTADPYRVKINDEETAEAIRRWDAGIRVANIAQFERKLDNGQWKIVYADSGEPIKGSDIRLSSDPRQ